MLSASIVLFREGTALKPFTKAQELELCKMLVTSSEPHCMCLTISVSVSHWHLLNKLRKSWVHIKMTWKLRVWGPHLQGSIVSCWGQISPHTPKVWTQSGARERRCLYCWSCGCQRGSRRPVSGILVQRERTLESLGLEGYPSCCLWSQFGSAYEKSGETAEWGERGTQSPWDEPRQGHGWWFLLFKAHYNLPV